MASTTLETLVCSPALGRLFNCPWSSVHLPSLFNCPWSVHLPSLFHSPSSVQLPLVCTPAPRLYTCPVSSPKAQASTHSEEKKTNKIQETKREPKQHPKLCAHGRQTGRQASPPCARPFQTAAVAATPPLRPGGNREETGRELECAAGCISNVWGFT